MLQLIPALLVLLKAGLEVAPEIIDAAELEMSLFRSATPPTPEQLATIATALDQANAALQQEALAMPGPAVHGAG